MICAGTHHYALENIEWGIILRPHLGPDPLDRHFFLQNLPKIIISSITVKIPKEKWFPIVNKSCHNGISFYSRWELAPVGDFCI